MVLVAWLGQFTFFLNDTATTEIYTLSLHDALPISDQYTVWNTDSNGNFLSNIGVVSGGSYAFQSLETSFHQDLNGDGSIDRPPPTVIDANTSTTHVHFLWNNGLYPAGAASGPPLKPDRGSGDAGLG